MADNKVLAPGDLRAGHVLVDESGQFLGTVRSVDHYTGGVVYAVTDELSVEFPAGTMARVQVPVRKTDYSTASANGLAFIANRWTYAGDEGYRVKHNHNTGRWFVVSYAGSTERPCYGNPGMTEDDAHAYAARLARMPVHPAPTEV